MHWLRTQAFCQAVHLCRALRDRKTEEKAKEKKKEEKEEGKEELSESVGPSVKIQTKPFFQNHTIKQSFIYYLGNKYITKIRISSFMVHKSTNYASQ